MVKWLHASGTLPSLSPPLCHSHNQPPGSLCVLFAAPLPTEWTLGTPPTYAGMNLTHFQCRFCSWSAAADPGLQFQRQLVWLDISYNPVAQVAGIATLPDVWRELPLIALKVRASMAAWPPSLERQKQVPATQNSDRGSV